MWSDELLLGNLIIDKQHKHLFAVAGDLLDNYSNKEAVDSKALEKTLGFLKEYAVNHFANEEKLQIVTKYEGYQEHKKMHEDFLVRLEFHENAIKQSDFSKKEIDSFINTLVAWLTNHISVEDRKIALKGVYVEV